MLLTLILESDGLCAPPNLALDVYLFTRAMNQIEENLSPIIERIKHKIIEQNVRLLSPLTLNHVESFEVQYKISLPVAYRRFLLEIGDGGEGPPAYGLMSLTDTVKDYHGKDLRPDQPFPLNRYWIWEDDPEQNELLQEAVFYNGHLYLGTDGCAMNWILIVTGEEHGNIWQTYDVGAQPCAPRRDFLSWYEYWLNYGDDWFSDWDK